MTDQKYPNDLKKNHEEMLEVIKGASPASGQEFFKGKEFFKRQWLFNNFEFKPPLEGIGSGIVSNFGVRADPFLSKPNHVVYALHTGLDIEAETGKKVYASAEGKVTVAGWQGGYGKLVEIDHGNGLVTRYGHLNSINVAVGDKIESDSDGKMKIIGEVGSTGRSTGPHLHYETREREGAVTVAVDPFHFRSLRQWYAESRLSAVSAKQKPSQPKP